jgi:hypothetical protein
LDQRREAALLALRAESAMVNFWKGERKAEGRGTENRGVEVVEGRGIDRQRYLNR